MLAVSGEIDMAGRRTLHGALEEAIDDAPRALVVDLSDVRFMDSTGLALMLNAARRLGRRQLGFAVACPAGPVRRAFEVAGLYDCIKITDRLVDALAEAQPAFSG